MTNKQIAETVSLYSETMEKAGTLYRYSDGTEKYIPSVPVYRNVKDRLFKFIFGNPDHKEWALNLYNWLEKTDYSDPDDLKIVTLENAVYMHMKNDTGVIVGTYHLSLWEHQSTFNPNVPFRLLVYVSSTFMKEFTKSHQNIYGRRQIRLPEPKFYVFYNGKEKLPAEQN